MAGRSIVVDRNPRRLNRVVGRVEYLGLVIVAHRGVTALSGWIHQARIYVSKDGSIAGERSCNYHLPVASLVQQPIPSPSTAPPELLFVDTGPELETYLPALQHEHRITIVDGAGAALRVLQQRAPAMVITELNLPDGRGEEICRRARQLTPIPSVLVTTSSVERVPVALAAGCDGVLLKPFAPNLLYARIGRLLRMRSMEVRMRAAQQMAKSAHLSERAAQVSAGTNRVWPATHCPYCSHTGIVNFDHAPHRLEWFACLACQKVWIAKSHEHMPEETIHNANHGAAGAT